MIIRIVDVESCGLPPDDAQVVEVATVDLMLVEEAEGVARTWTRGRTWSSLVDPGRPIPPEASAIHHITDNDVKGAPTIDALEAMITADEGTGVPAHYAAHEAKFEKACLPWLADRIDLCTRKCAATLWPDAPNHKNMTLRYWLRLKLADPSLATPHRAAGDAYVTAAILRRMLSIQGIGVGDLVAVSAKPVLLSRFNFGKHAMQPFADVPTDYLDWVINKSKFDDEDVLHTARTHLAERRAAQKQRSPV